MSAIQLLIKEAEQESYKNWVISVHDPLTDKQSEEFYFYGPGLDSEKNADYLFVGSSDNGEDFEENVRPYIIALCESNNIQIVIGQYTYSKSKKMVKKLARCIKQIKGCSASAREILLNEDWKSEEVRGRRVEIITV